MELKVRKLGVSFMAMLVAAALSVCIAPTAYADDSLSTATGAALVQSPDSGEETAGDTLQLFADPIEFTSADGAWTSPILVAPDVSGTLSLADGQDAFSLVDAWGDACDSLNAGDEFRIVCDGESELGSSFEVAFIVTGEDGTQQSALAKGTAEQEAAEAGDQQQANSDTAEDADNATDSSDDGEASGSSDAAGTSAAGASAGGTASASSTTSSSNNSSQSSGATAGSTHRSTSGSASGKSGSHSHSSKSDSASGKSGSHSNKSDSASGKSKSHSAKHSSSGSDDGASQGKSKSGKSKGEGTSSEESANQDHKHEKPSADGADDAIGLESSSDTADEQDVDQPANGQGDEAMPESTQAASLAVLSTIIAAVGLTGALSSNRREGRNRPQA